ncbi:MAG: M48 family metallopeptidase [Planctomycetota bacterium]|jgi:Zn-dependent protease with chaperone function
MLTLPEWDQEFTAQSKRYTLRLNAYKSGRVLVMFMIPWTLAMLFGLNLGARPFLAITLFFVALLASYTIEQIVWGLCRRQKRRTMSALLGAIPELLLLWVLCAYWWLLFPGHIALAIGAWWAFGVLLALHRYVWRTWALRKAVLKTKDYRLYGRRTGRLTKRVKHDKASLYELPKDSAFGPRAIIVLASGRPEVYVSEEARSLLDADQLRAVIAHELGHSWSQHHVGYELGEWVRRMFFVPVTGWAASAFLAMVSARIEPVVVFVFLTLLVAVWKANSWASNLLGRPRELGADLYAVEMTRTPEAFVEGMKRLAKLDRYHVFPSLYDAVGFCSHPCIVKRLAYVASALEVANSGSDRGRRRRKRARG